MRHVCEPINAVFECQQGCQRGNGRRAPRYGRRGEGQIGADGVLCVERRSEKGATGAGLRLTACWWERSERGRRHEGGTPRNGLEVGDRGRFDIAC